MKAYDFPLPEALNVQYYLPDRSSGLQLKVRPIKDAFPTSNIAVFLDWRLIFQVPMPADWVAPIILDIPASSLGPDGVYQLQWGLFDPDSEVTFPSDPVTIIIGPVNN
ncbi:hypothetical protein VA602_00485 [Pseudomonas sp. MH2]|uniref:Uncharacterized protein n=1 Tax=Pseudomonas machongensis TaxID=3110229 RepID=A0ABU5VBH8_9PSED|nr:hypothetical protein [Pseudomonas sp. MH2]MEA5669815.1 hypothetical protein [Pseudomonas sp. MH2]